MTIDPSGTLTELRHTLDAAAFPTHGLAVRAAALATDDNCYAELLRGADGQYLRAARLWLQIASYVDDDDDELVAALRLSADCAGRGGNASFARNCMRRVVAAERRRECLGGGLTA